MGLFQTALRNAAGGSLNDKAGDPSGARLPAPTAAANAPVTAGEEPATYTTQELADILKFDEPATISSKALELGGVKIGGEWHFPGNPAGRLLLEELTRKPQTASTQSPEPSKPKARSAKRRKVKTVTPAASDSSTKLRVGRAGEREDGT